MNINNDKEIIILDGAYGEGGGQIVRTALALSMLTQKPFKIENIRKNRSNPGLKAQHLAGIKTLIDLSGSLCFGTEIGSTEIEFHPKKINKFRTTIDIETAGSITLLMQTIIPPLLFLEKESRIKIIGGTDVTHSPQIDYIINVFSPQIKRFADVKIDIDKRGYYPKGQGKIQLTIKPKYNINSFQNIEEFLKKIEEEKIIFDLTKRKNLLFIRGISHASKDLLQADVCERQKKGVRSCLNKLNVPIMIRTEYQETASTGSGITLFAGFSENDEINEKNPIIIGSDELGEKGKRSEIVGEKAAKKLLDEIDNDAGCDSHLIDMLIPFMAISKGEIKTSKITQHTISNIYVTEQFLNIKFEVDENNKIISLK